MAVATIAAFVIGDFAEAVGVMLFYRIGELFEDIAVERAWTDYGCRRYAPGSC